MLHLRYSTGYWICFDFRICPNCQYTRVLNMSGLHKVLNKLLHDRCLTVLWICLGFWIWQGFKYARVMNEISKIDIWHGSEYASNSDYGSFTQGSVENAPSYMFDRVLSIARVLNVLGLEYASVVNIARLHMVLCKLF